MNGVLPILFFHHPKHFFVRAGWVAALWLLLLSSAIGQSSPTLGLAFGYSYVQEQLPEGNPYQPYLIMARYTVYLSKSGKKGKPGLIVEPQVNPVSLGKGGSTIELGLNAGITYGWDLGRSHLYGGISAGPHYTGVRTSLQARGFIFSDNFFVGLRSPLRKNIQLDLQARFRHLSNAGIQSPNKGIDNFLVVIGLNRMKNRKGKQKNATKRL
jgi:hypothetical protein